MDTNNWQFFGSSTPFPPPPPLLVHEVLRTALKNFYDSIRNERLINKRCLGPRSGHKVLDTTAEQTFGRENGTPNIISVSDGAGLPQYCLII